MRERLGLPVLAELPGPGTGLQEAGPTGYAVIRRTDLEISREMLAGVHELLLDPGCILVAHGDQAPQTTSVALALATAAALDGARTLLIECNLARAALARILGLSPAPGLHEYLAWEAEAAQILQPVELSGAAVGSPPGQLVCIVGGAATDDAAGLLASDSFSHVMSKVRKAYEVVVLAGGSVLEPEVPLLAVHADGVALCLGRQETGGRAAREINAALARLPACPAGLLLVGD